MKKTILPLMIFTTLMSTSLLNAQEAVSVPVGVTYIAALNAQTDYFIGTEGLSVRSTPVDSGKRLGTLSLNDKVRVVNPSVIHNGKFVQVIITKSYNKMSAEAMFVDRNYLSSKIVDYKEFKGKYFAVVNVASETLRLYERSCLSAASCSNKMILETEVVVGEDKDHPASEPGKGRSVLGSYRVTGWAKFYEDAGGHYPAWYKEGSPELPEVGNSGTGWFSKKVMPKDAEGKRSGSMRGAFGWYAAFVGPNAYGQWAHGTIGHGADKDAMIKRTKKALINIISDPRSSGCTRNNNEAIAILRTYLQVGDPMIKIYAREAIEDTSLSRYPELTESWNYILTKDKNHAVAEDDVLNLKNFSESMVLERGTYEKDVRPDATPFTPGEKLSKMARQTKRTGNVYGIKTTSMSGVFYVDTGVLEGYAHPNEVLEISGLKEVTPPFMTR